MDSQILEDFTELAVLAEKQQNVVTVGEIVERVLEDAGTQFAGNSGLGTRLVLTQERNVLSIPVRSSP